MIISSPPPRHYPNQRDRKTAKWACKAIVSLCATVALTELVFTAQILSRKTSVTLTFHQLGYDDPHGSFLKQRRTSHSGLKARPKGIVPNNHLVIDILSAGSKSRPDFLQAQRETFALHRSVRYFVGVTEDDDLSEPNCASNLTREDVEAVTRYCKNPESIKEGKGLERSILNRLRNFYKGWKTLSELEYPQGWLCAQRRPGDNLYRLLQLYHSNKNASTPDYLMLMDDDTFVDVTAITKYLEDFYDADDPLIMAGCLQQRDDHPFSTPWGGWGTIISRGAIFNLGRPINCTIEERDVFVENACQRLEQNQFDERRYFQQGMTVADLFHAYVSTNRFADHKSWSEETGSFCSHASWVWGYFFNYYNIGSHTGDPFLENIPEARLASYRLSHACNDMSCATLEGECGNVGNNCIAGKSHICHYLTPETMRSLSAAHREIYPSSFVSEPMVVASDFSNGWDAVWTKPRQSLKKDSAIGRPISIAPRQRTAIRATVVDVFVYTHQSIHHELEEFIFDGVEQSRLLKLTEDPAQAPVWIVDVNSAGFSSDHTCKDFVQIVEQAKLEKVEADQLQDWKVAFLYWDDDAMNDFLDCYQATRLIDSTRVCRFKRAIVTGRHWNDTTRFIDRGHFVNYGNWREHSAAPVGHINYGVRSDFVEAMRQLIGKNTDPNAEDFVVHEERLTEVSHIMPLKGEGTKGTTSRLSNTVSKILQETFAHLANSTDISISVGLRGQVEHNGHELEQQAYLTRLLDSKIVVVSQDDIDEDQSFLMEALASGAMVMTDPMLTLPEGLKEGESIVVYHSLEDLVSKIQYYLGADQERQSVAREGYNVAMGMYRSWQMMEKIVFNGMLN